MINNVVLVSSVQQSDSVIYTYMNVKITQSYLTLCDPMDYTLHGILQARILERVAFPFSRDLPSSRDSNPPGIEPSSPAL